VIAAAVNPWRAAAIVLAIALAATAAAAWILADAWLEARDARLQAAAERDQAAGVARSCSAGVERLQRLADQRAQEARRAQQEARRQALSHQQAAQQILASPPAVPGDACASAEAAIDAWLQGRPRK
jgi:inorganic triphosphatase YgiF